MFVFRWMRTRRPFLQNSLRRSFCSQPSDPKRQRQQERQRFLRQKQLKEIEEMNDKFNRTKGKFNPFTEYWKLHIMKLKMVALIALFLYYAEKVSSTVGFTEDLQDPNKKKLMLISQKYEQKVSKILLKMFCNYYQPQQPTAAQNKKLHILQTKLKPKIVTCDQPILIVLPGEQYVISSSLLRDLPSSSLNKLIALFQALFRQRLHIKELRMMEIFTFWDYESAESEIKLREMYCRPYSRDQILRSVKMIEGLEVEDLEGILQEIKAINQDNVSQSMVVENLWKRIKGYERNEENAQK